MKGIRFATSLCIVSNLAIAGAGAADSGGTSPGVLVDMVAARSPGERAGLQRALSIYEEQVPGSLRVASSLVNLGRIARDDGDLAAAERHFSRALEIGEKQAPGSVDTAACLYNLGELRALEGDPAASEAFFRRALSIRERLAPGSLVHARTLHALAALYRNSGRAREAATYYGLAIDAFEAQKGRLGGTHETRSSFSANYLYLYLDAVEQLHDLGRGADAFHALERSRARGLLAMLAERDIVFADIPEDLAREQRRIDTDYDRTQKSVSGLDPKTDSRHIEELLGQLRQLQGRRAEIAERIRLRSSRLASLRYPNPFDLTQTQDVLDEGTVLLSYCVAKNRTLLFVVEASGDMIAPAGESAQGLHVYDLAVTSETLRSQVESFRRAIEQAERGVADLSQSVRWGRELYDELVKPAEALIGPARRILICPDGPLHSLPFAALVQGTPVRPPLRTGTPPLTYLVQWKPLHVIVSATVYAELRKETPASAPRLDLVAFGDPLYSSDRSGEPVTRSAPDAQTQTFSGRGPDLRPLPSSRREVERIAAVFAGAAVTYLGPAATEERATSIGKGVRYIHFACHGLLDERFPLDSALALSTPPGSASAGENGLLQAWEIFEKVRIDAEMVTLSACKSGLGRELGGEGLIGLTRAFQYAGARSVVASLWDVSDRSTSELMGRFYAYIRAGKTKDEALRSAQIDLITSPAVFTAHPYHWAAFELIGDWN